MNAAERPTKPSAQPNALANHLAAAREEERERIARDLHDTLGGHLVAIKIETALLAAQLEAEPLRTRAGATGYRHPSGCQRQKICQPGSG